MAEIENKTQTPEEVTDVKENKTPEEETKQEKSVDVEQVKKNAINEYLKSLGVEDSETLSGIVTKAKEEEDKNKTELQRSNDTLTATTKELAAEKEARIIAEAKLSAIQLGAKPELVDDLVIVAKSKVTKDKDIDAVIAEIKDSNSGKVYFSDETEKEEKEKTENKTVTRKRVTKESKTEKEDEPKTRAERIFASKKQAKKHYFS